MVAVDAAYSRGIVDFYYIDLYAGAVLEAHITIKAVNYYIFSLERT